MGMAFSESTNKTGLYELHQDLTKTNTSSYPIAKYTRDANNALAYFMMLAIMSSKKAEVDDTNQGDYPVLKFNLISGQADYAFVSDGAATPNQVLDIERVECIDASGNYNVLLPYDKSEEKDSLVQAATLSGTPYRYDKRSNGIFLDPKPNYNYRYTQEGKYGLYVYVSRTATYFLSSDTTKKPGIPDQFHQYLAYRPAYFYCLTNIPALAPGYLAEMTRLEEAIGRWYTQRNRDEKNRFTLSTNKGTSGYASGRLGSGPSDSNK